MYDNLRAEMARHKVTGKVIAASLGIDKKTFGRRMNGKSEFTIKEAKTIAQRFFPNKSLDELFGDMEGSA